MFSDWQTKTYKLMYTFVSSLKVKFDAVIDSTLYITEKGEN